MAPKPKKIAVGATQNIDNALFENYSRPRLRIKVMKNEPKKIAKVEITRSFPLPKKF